MKTKIQTPDYLILKISRQGFAVLTALDAIASNDIARFPLNGILFERVGETNTYKVTACNGHMLVQVKLDELAACFLQMDPPEKMILDIRNAGAMHAQDADAVLLCVQPVKGEYPDYEKVLPKHDGMPAGEPIWAFGFNPRYLVAIHAVFKAYNDWSDSTMFKVTPGKTPMDPLTIGKVGGDCYGILMPGKV